MRPLSQIGVLQVLSFHSVFYRECLQLVSVQESLLFFRLKGQKGLRATPASIDFSACMG